MWSDTWMLAERAHFLRVAAWGTLCVLAGTAVIAALAVRRGRARSPLLTHFAAQTAAWGTLELIYVAISLWGLVERDMSGVARLANQIWLYSGLDIGLIGVGVAIATCGWKFGQRLGAVGAGIGIAIQGLGLLTLDLYFITIIQRSVAPRTTHVAPVVWSDDRLLGPHQSRVRVRGQASRPAGTQGNPPPLPHTPGERGGDPHALRPG